MMLDVLLDKYRAMRGFGRLDAGMVRAAMESLRRELESTSDPLDASRAIAAQIGATNDPERRRLLMRVGAEFTSQIVAERAVEIERAFQVSAADGWNAWLTALGEFVSRFRFDLAVGLCKRAFRFDESRHQQVDMIVRAVERMFQSRWEEVYEEVVFLSEQDVLPMPVRARLICMRAQIDFHRFDNPAGAKPLFEKAAAISPDDAGVVAGLADYWQGQGDAEKAAGMYHRAIELDPHDHTGYVGLGEQREKEARFDEAEAWYRKAISLAGGNVSGYTRLLGLIGRPATLADREPEFRTLLERAREVDPDEEYNLYLTAAGYYLAAGRVADARRFYEKAIALRKDWPRAYAELAELCRTQENPGESETLGRKAVEVAPECPGGYLVLCSLYEEQSRWADALKIYEQFPLRPRQWAGYVRASIGRMLAKLGKPEQAESALLDALRDELKSRPSPTHAERALEELAEATYKTGSNRESAMRIYGEILQIVGRTYEDRYRSLTGDLNYHLGNYSAAIEEYGKAIAAKPDYAPYHRHLSKAFSAFGDYDTAEDELDRAFAIDKDETLWKENRAGLANIRGTRQFENAAYDQALRCFTKAIELAPVEPVYHANLAGALQRVNDPGMRLSHLDQAVSCYLRAQLLSKNEKYEQQIERLRRRIAFAKIYGERSLDRLNVVTPLAAEVAYDLIGSLAGPSREALSEECAASIKAMRTRVQNGLGAQVPGIRVRGNETDLTGGTYIVMIKEIPLVSGNVSPDRRFWPGTGEALGRLEVQGDGGINPVSGDDGFWIAEKDWARFEAEGLTLWSPTEYIVRHIEAVVRKNMTEFFGHQEAVDLLESHPCESAGEIRGAPAMVTALVTVCRSLLFEEVPIRQFEELCGTFRSCYESGVSLRETVEQIRNLPAIRAHLPSNDGAHRLLKLGQGFELEIRRSLFDDDGRLILAMTPERCQDALTAIRAKVDGQRSSALIVEDRTLRPFVRKLVETEFPALHVLSRSELEGDAALTAVIELADEHAAGTFEISDQARRARGDIEASTERRELPTPANPQIKVFVSPDFEARVSVADDGPIDGMFGLLQDGLFYELGITLPDVQLSVDRSLSSGGFRFELNGGDSGPIAGLAADEFMVNDTSDRLTLINISARDTVNPANGVQCAIVLGQSQVATCKRAGLTTWGPPGFLVLHLAACIRRAAASFETDAAAQYALDSLAEAFPSLVRFALDRYDLTRLARLLRELLDEGISIRDLRGVLESVLAINGTTNVDLSRFIVFFANPDALCPGGSANVSKLSSSQLADYVRMSSKRYISHKYTQGSNTLVVYLLDPAIEERITAGLERPVGDVERHALSAAIQKELDKLPPTGASPVLLTTFGARRVLRKIIERDFPYLAVLSYQELAPDMNIQPVERISWTLPVEGSRPVANAASPG